MYNNDCVTFKDFYGNTWKFNGYLNTMDKFFKEFTETKDTDGDHPICSEKTNMENLAPNIEKKKINTINIEDNINMMLYEALPLPMPTKIIANEPYTIVFFSDGSKQIVKCAEDEHYTAYSGFVNAIAVKMFGNNSALKRFIKNHTQQPKSVSKTKAAQAKNEAKTDETEPTE